MAAAASSGSAERCAPRPLQSCFRDSTNPRRIPPHPLRSCFRDSANPRRIPPRPSDGLTDSRGLSTGSDRRYPHVVYPEHEDRPRVSVGVSFSTSMMNVYVRDGEVRVSFCIVRPDRFRTLERQRELRRIEGTEHLAIARETRERQARQEVAEEVERTRECLLCGQVRSECICDTFVRTFAQLEALFRADPVCDYCFCPSSMCECTA